MERSHHTTATKGRARPRLLGYLAVVLVAALVLLHLVKIPNAAHHPDVESALSFSPEEPYDFAYVEFSEHGNLFDRSLFKELLRRIEENQSHGPTAVVVFVHGWHHNAAPDRGNVRDFKALLAKIAERGSGPFASHRVIGVYVGWRGELIDLPGLRHVTFWDRKSAAEEIARGGVTEVLLRLERLSRCGSSLGPCRAAEEAANRLLIIGHSFGGAIVFSALSEVIAERLINAKHQEDAACADEPGDVDGSFNEKRGAPCVVADRFAHGVVLLNPAIEANQALQLKELIASHQYADAQDILLHIISSEGDQATRIAFPVGQWLRNLTWDATNLRRRYVYAAEPEKPVEYSEGELTRTTIGNFAPFRTGRVGAWGEYYPCWNKARRAYCAPGEERDRIPIGPNEPVQFLLTDAEFIGGHNDVFNCQVESYLLAIANESVSTRRGDFWSFGEHYRRLLESCPGYRPPRERHREAVDRRAVDREARRALALVQLEPSVP